MKHDDLVKIALAYNRNDEEEALRLIEEAISTIKHRRRNHENQESDAATSSLAKD